MKVISALLAIALVCVVADDKSYCETACKKRYEEENQKACDVGCEHRGSLSSGSPLGFVNCHRFCDENFGNTTSGKTACHFACSLPMRSSVVMTLVNDNGKHHWKVVRQDGDEEPVVSMANSSPLSNFLVIGRSRPNDLISLKAPDSSEEESDEAFGDMGQFHQQMRQIMESIHIQVLNSLRDDIAKSQDNLAVARPSGHNAWANGRSVGNQDLEGQPMILTRPVEDGGENGLVLEFHHRERRSRFLIIFHWLLVAVGIAALCTTILAIFLFLRSIRNNNYRRMGHDATMPVFARVQPSPIPVKKVPEAGWMDPPSGNAPPAYDQVSIHASPKTADSDKSTSEAETPSPTH